MKDRIQNSSQNSIDDKKDALALAMDAAPHPSVVWRQKLNGLITDLSVSAQATSILVATSPNPDADDGQHGFALSRYDQRGRLAWKRDAGGPVKYVSVSRDGSFVVAAVYDELLTAFNSAGRTIWTRDAICKPLILEKTKRIICYHDDDSEPRIAFEVMNWNGKLRSSFPIERDVLALKVAPDEDHLALALTRGELVAVGADFKKPLWRAQVQGEVVDLAITSGKDFRLGVVFTDAKKQGHLAVFSSRGQLLAEQALDAPAQAIEPVSRTDGFAVYSNGPAGQEVALWALTKQAAKPALAALWRAREREYGEYSAALSTALIGPSTGASASSSGEVVAGVEEAGSKTRRQRLVGFGQGGATDWAIAFEPDIAVYLYGLASEAAGGPAVVVARDDSELSLYRLPKTPRTVHSLR